MLKSYVNNISVKEMIRINRTSGYNFFDKQIMKEMGRQIEISPDWLGYFLTSDIKLREKVFTIRKFNFETGEVLKVEDNISNKDIAKKKMENLRINNIKNRIKPAKIKPSENFDYRKNSTSQIVQHLLETYPNTRNNDHLLYTKYNEKVYQELFTQDHFINYNQSLESISRIRRKIQAKYPMLKSLNTY